MERRGGCCIGIAMYGGGGDAEAAWRMGRIMLRFRPIAPKPAAGSSEVVSAVSELSPLGRKTRRKGSGAASRGRKKRKVEAKPSPYCKDDQKASELSSSANTTTTICSPTIVTLPLMPEADERRGDTAERQRTSSGSERPLLAPGWIGCEEAAARAPWLVTAVGSWVTVESVTDTWREWEVAWRSDEAVRAALAVDECPGLISDEWNRVTWTNEAYRRMVAGDSSDEGAGGGRAEEEARVRLVARAAVPAADACRAFTCRMRVHYRKQPGRPERALSSLAAPCDVWRLDDGGRAWRIDVKAALSLSL
ncbi:uncharacterized protein LOC122039193 [Zingiber officinale]|uniref:uncharacterized protein LOC122006349 n=1 Tax=Zingiber officinale TaxID=94328 RepID=UPI001C4BCFA0|nr:uncharacterized protein LOC122006349 [Zingiber officinale]XP_042455038.1 uncharacterized protein LOC122039193 [Zingiber officinale]